MVSRPEHVNCLGCTPIASEAEMRAASEEGSADYPPADAHVGRTEALKTASVYSWSPVESKLTAA